MAVDRLPPQNLEAERSVLGSLLIDPEGYVKVAGSLRTEDFYRTSHRLVFEAIQTLGNRREPADFVTVCEELERMQALQQVGGEAFVSSLANEVPSAFHVEFYAGIVRRASVLRQIIDGASQIAAMAYTSDAEAVRVLDAAAGLVGRIREQASGNSRGATGEHRAVDWAEFWQTDPAATDWLVEPILPRGRAIAIYSPPKTGK